MQQEELIQRLTSIATGRRAIYTGIANGSTGSQLSVTLDNGISVEARNINVENPGVPVGVVFDSAKQEYVAFSVEEPNQLVNRTPLVERHRRGTTKVPQINITSSYIAGGEQEVEFNIDVYKYTDKTYYGLVQSTTPAPPIHTSLFNTSIPASIGGTSFVKKRLNYKTLPKEYKVAGKNRKRATAYMLFGDNVSTTGYQNTLPNSKTNLNIFSVICTPFVDVEFQVFTGDSRNMSQDFRSLGTKLKRFKADLKIKNPSVRLIYETICRKYCIFWRLLRRVQPNVGQWVAYGSVDEDGVFSAIESPVPTGGQTATHLNFDTKILSIPPVINPTPLDVLVRNFALEVGCLSYDASIDRSNYGIYFKNIQSPDGVGTENYMPFNLKEALKKEPGLDPAMVDRLLQVNGVLDVLNFFI